MALTAQTCAGVATFAGAPVRIEALVGVHDSQSSLGAGFAAGAHNSFFVRGGILRTYHDSVASPTSIYAVQRPSTDYEVDAGYQLVLLSRDRLQACPVAQYDHASAALRDPDGVLTHVTGSLVAFGLAVGGIASHSETVDFVPALGLEYSSLHSRVRQDAPFSPTIDERSETDAWTATVAAGFVLNRVISLVPSVSIPFGLVNAKATYGITIGFNFGPS